MDPTPAAPASVADHRRAVPESAILAAICALSAALTCWGLDRNRWGNPYYAAAMRSMSRSWHNFFFVAFDPGGFISVDKPPLALWVVNLSVRTFGYSSWAILLPGALATVATVALLWVTVRHRFGPTAAAVAALALALTPVTVAVARVDLPDPFMILLLVAAAAAAGRVADSSMPLRWTAASAAAVGLAFNTKMLAALVVVPALGAAIALGSLARGRRAVVVAGVVFTATLAITSAPWIVAVDHVDPAARPYVGGSSDDTVGDLVFGYNGLGRVDGAGQRGGAPDPTRGAGTVSHRLNVAASSGPGGVYGGTPGPFRLFGDALAGQIAWLLPAALALGAAAAWVWRRHRAQLADLILWGGWVVVHAAVFSQAKGIFHAYYTSALSPAVAALVGIGGVTVTRRCVDDRRWLWGAAVILAASVGVAAVIDHRTAGFEAWSVPVMVGLTLAAVGAAVVAWRHHRPVTVRAAATLAAAAVLVTPAGWAAAEATTPPLNTTLPQAGPRVGVSGNTFGSQVDDAPPVIVTFLRHHHGRARWDVITANAQTASDLIASGRLSVMALGGFSGTDPATTLHQVATRIRSGEVRYVYARPWHPRPPHGTARGMAPPPPPPGGHHRPPPTRATRIIRAVERVCRPLTPADTGGAIPPWATRRLYDCAGLADALEASPGA